MEPNTKWHRSIETEKRFWVDNGVVGLEFCRSSSDSGWLLQSITDIRQNTVFGLQSSRDCVWWELEWRDRSGFRAMVNNKTPGHNTLTCDLAEDGKQLIVLLRWTDISIRQGRYGTIEAANSVDPEGLPDDIEVDIRIKISKDSPLTQWSMTVHSNSTRYTLWNAEFIKVTDMHLVGADRRNDFLTIPVEYGWDVPYPTNRRTRWSALYPSHRCSMQFLAFRNNGRGLYVGWHDPDAKIKTFEVVADSGEQLEISFQNHPEQMTRVQSHVVIDGLTLGTFTGDWFDAAQIYRHWALQQRWTRKGLVADREDIPDWFKSTVLWWCLSSGKDTGSLSTKREVMVEETAEMAIKLHERFPYASGVHWYNWHKIPFNTSFPDFLPAKPGFADQVARLGAAGIVVMPYINGRLMDPNSRSWQEDDAERFCARKSSPRCEPHHYPLAYEIYPGEQRNVAMCSATTYWQEKVASIARAMREQLGIRALYLDQVAATAPSLCFAPDHGHSQGGGNYGVRGYEQMLDLVQQAGWSESGPMALTTETNAEPFMSGVPGYLMWMPNQEYQIPLFASIYSGYVITFGRSFYDADLEEPDAFITKIAQQFTWGCQLGWIRNSVAENLITAPHTREAAFLDAACRAFASGREYLVEGHMLRFPAIESPVKMIMTKWHGNQVQLPSVMTTLWRSQNHSVALAVANVNDDTVCVQYRVNLPMGGANGVKDVTDVGVIGDVKPLDDGSTKITLTIPGLTAAIVELEELWAQD